MSTQKNDSVKKSLESNFSVEGKDFAWSQSLGCDVLNIPAPMVEKVFSFLKENKDFDFLMNISGADYPGKEKRFEVVYELFQSSTANRLRVKTQVADGESVPTLTKVWRGADWLSVKSTICTV